MTFAIIKIKMKHLKYTITYDYIEINTYLITYSAQDINII